MQYVCACVIFNIKRRARIFQVDCRSCMAHLTYWVPKIFTTLQQTNHVQPHLHNSRQPFLTRCSAFHCREFSDPFHQRAIINRSKIISARGELQVAKAETGGTATRWKECQEFLVTSPINGAREVGGRRYRGRKAKE